MAYDAPAGYRFDAYEYVVSSGELHRLGHRLRLSDQQARLLRGLLERHGEVVTRQELRNLLWPDGEFLDHDHAIRNAVNQLRAVLRDSPRKPRFIETLPKRGYRFVAKVTCVAEAAPETPKAQQSADQSSEAELGIAKIESAGLTHERQSNLSSQPWRLARRWALPAGVAMLIAGLTYAAMRRMSYLGGKSHPAAGIITLGIAPIEAKGPEAQQLAEPFRAELVDAASQLPGVEVRATHSFPDLAAIGDLHDLAQKLQLDSLLLGKIEATGDHHFNFVFELVRGSDAVHLASLHLSGSGDQLGTIRNQIQRDLFFHLSGANRRLKPLHSTENPSAYNEYLSGRAQLIRHDDAAIQQAIADFHQAVADDPAFAQAYAGLGSAYMLAAEHASAGREAFYEAAHANSVKAIGLNPEVGEAHATLGFLAFRHDWNAVASEVEFRRAIELDPNQAMHRILYALLLCNTGRSSEALDQIALAHAADPLWPPVYITEMYVASAAGLNDRALETARRLIELMPNWPLAYDQSAWAFWYAGRREDAVKEWIRMAKLEQDQQRLALEEQGVKILHRQGVAAYSRYKLYAIEQDKKWNHPNDFQLAEWQINAGRDSDALVSLQQMVRDHDPEALQFAASPAYARLRENPAFRALLKQIGLPLP
jgi:DNA-binding winged helix-turn-helix (wHTH) protein/tetratricopeptide (TPR) repeat protein